MFIQIIEQTYLYSAYLVKFVVLQNTIFVTKFSIYVKNEMLMGNLRVILQSYQLF